MPNADCGNVGFDIAPKASLPQGTGIKAPVGVHKKAFERYLRFLDQVAQLVKQGLDVKQVGVVARLRAGAGQGLALVVGQKEQIGGAGSFAALVAIPAPPLWVRVWLPSSCLLDKSKRDLCRRKSVTQSFFHEPSLRHSLKW